MRPYWLIGAGALALTVTATIVAGIWYYAAAHPHPAQARLVAIEEFGPAHSGRIGPKDSALSPLPVKPGRMLKMPILMYHHVGYAPANADAIRRDLTVSPEDFTREVEWLHLQGYTSLTLAELYQDIAANAALPRKPIIFTFDDGYTDVFDNAVPVLKKYNYAGSFAIITQYPGHAEYATWDQIRAAEKQGMEIVSHTQDHFDGSNVHKYPPEFVRADLEGARRDLERELKHSVNILVYPYGHYTPEYVKIAHDLGYVMGLTVHFGRDINIDDLMEMPRVRVHGREDFEVFKKILTGK